MSNFTTELRYICEAYAGFSDSVGLDKFEEVINGSVEKIFDFDYPIFMESYRKVLEKKILTHYYTREIGYETVGRWKLALRSKMQEIMPYYNELYKNSAKFGSVNIFDDRGYTVSNTKTFSGLEKDNVRDNTSSNSTERGVINESKNTNFNKDSVTSSDNTENATSNSLASKNSTSNTSENTNGFDEVKETNTNTKSEKGKVTENANNSAQTKQDSSGSETSRSVNKESSESGSHEDYTAESDNNTINSSNDVKKRLYSDTPSGALDFGDGGEGVDGITTDYITNLTKDVGSSNSTANAASVSHNVGDTANTNSVNGEQNNSGSTTQHSKVNTEGSENRETVNSNNAYESETTNGIKKHEVDTSNVSSYNDKVTSNNEVNKSNTSKVDVSENNVGSETNKVNNNVSKTDVKQRVEESYRTNDTTEGFVESVKGKFGDASYSAMFIDFTKALINVDLMVIEELQPLFMGLWE